MHNYLIPSLLLLASLIALYRKESTYDILLLGAKDGLQLLVSIVPALVLLLTAVSALRASGAVEALSALLSPIFPFCWHPAGNGAAGVDTPHQRQRRPGRRCGFDGPIRRGFPNRQDRGRDAGLYRDDLLYRQCLFQCRRNPQDPLYCPRGAAGRFDGLYYGES